MRIATVEQSREIDRLSQVEYGLPGDILMEAAGCSAAREIEQSYFPELKRGTIGVVCGPGNNGGDGLVVARHLHSSGHRDLIVFVIAPPHGLQRSQKSAQKQQQSDLFQIQMKRVEKQGIRVVDLVASPSQMEQLRSCTLFVDAIFGTGLRLRIEDPFARVIEVMNSVQSPIVAMDTPSGLDADRGTVLGVAVRAAMTCTFGLAKPGFFVNEGPSRVGRLRILPIGFPLEVFRKVAVSHFGFNEKLARRYLPKRQDTSNKSNHGRVMVFAGQPGMWGAGLLASSAAYRMGVGYVTLAGFGEPLDVLTSMPEVLTANIEQEKFWRPEAWDAVVIGPGFGVNAKTADLIERLRASGATSVVVDADAITTCVDFRLFPLPESWILTPHAGELARILNVDAQTIEKDRYAHALQASRYTGCHVLLKGFRSVLAHRNRCLVIMAGNSALAKAGTGDVLSGMIASLLAQKVEPVQAAATAAYIHGRMADEWVRSGKDKRALTASDLREQLPVLMARLAGGALL
ncbi:MAG: NAD(P)H-hydrate dehydratase [Bdellovibrionaceae bacterium]|nr:NAD(P)H-hydrate dehydratase [Pseudobdellovibrionaceae bacterium]